MGWFVHSSFSVDLWSGLFIAVVWSIDGLVCSQQLFSLFMAWIVHSSCSFGLWPGLFTAVVQMVYGLDFSQQLFS